MVFLFLLVQHLDLLLMRGVINYSISKLVKINKISKQVKYSLLNPKKMIL